MIARRPCPVLLLVAALALVACDDEGHGNVKTGFGDDMGQVGEDARPDEPIDRSDADPDGTGLGGDEGPRETDDQGVPPDVRDMAPDMLDAEPPEDDADTEPPDRGDMDASGPDGCEPGAVMRCGEGECPGGVKHCTADGRFGECEPPPELCGDNADNDCDGRVDETLVGNAVPCHVGVGGCARDGVLYCAGGFVECSAQPGDASEEVCNGIDDDCDEATDEGVGGNVPCAFGDGICRARGLTICDAGGNVYCPAEAGEPADDERCDGLDDDCDGVVDEPFDVGADCVLGLGACARDGVRACGPDGEGLCQADVGSPADELCNAIDDDCDGITDEDFGGGMPCAEGVGACRRDGVMACAAGGALRCSVAAGAPTDETCDGRDEDCDGQIDEGLGLGDACAVGVGLCRREATKTCDDSGGLRCAVSPGEPAVETCDGRDEDCDGRTDEGFDIGASCAAGVGACQAMGTKRCAPDGAATLCDAMPGAPGDEACNGRDDDCDGRTDEAFNLGAACISGMGLCARDGRRVCAPGGAGTACEPGPGEPQAEVCDGLDQDCDGRVDEEFDLGAACVVGLGACAVEGRRVCAADGSGAACDAVPGRPGVETCDGVDEDCDGRVDEGFDLGTPCLDGIGQCARQGQRVCDPNGRGAVCDARPGAPEPERCEGTDEDCDGRVDEDFDLGAACAEGVGACRAEGVRACDANGGAHCTAEPGAPQAERCNGIDDDCDGRSEEGLGLGEACTEGIGACARTGRFICDNNGGVTCSVRAGPSAAETCNAIDDDCDGRVDETFPLGQACAVGLGRCERAGVFICAGGAAVCDVSPGDRRDERCDGIDDDCDGRTDEDFPLGRPCTEGIGACLRRGAEECTADGTGTQCSASAGEPQPDTCNAIDDDCDGTTDEDYPLGAACTVGLGECRNRGGFICGDDGDAVCDVDPLPAAVERCDGRDEDCDGRVDEDFDLGGACVVGLGICARPGVKVCAPDGTGDCQGLVGPPEEEGCDDLDNDCDGLVDEGEGPQAGEAFALCGPRYRSCLDALRAGRVQSGVYRISPVDHAGQLVYCDQTTDGGGWTLVGNTRTTPLLDQLSPWYDDLTRLVPQAAHAGIWNGLAHLDEQAFDVRFACRAAPPGAERQFDVDLAFYGTPWYREFIIGPDAQTCFLPGDQVAAEPAPARRDLNTGEVRANGQPYAGAAGRLVGERRCANETDFAVDFDDQGIGGVVDATDWGAQARVPRCGGLAVNNGHWLVFARESQARGLGRIGLLGVPSLEQPVRAAGFEPVLLDYDADALMDALDPETLPAIFIGRYAHDWALFSDGVRQSLSDYNAAGGSVVTEYDGASLFASRMDPEFLYADGAPDVMEWVTALVGHGGERGPATPIHHLVIGDPVLRGVPDPFASAEGTQRFLTYSRSHSTLPIDMRPLAWFAGDDGEWPDAVNYALLRGVRCEGNLLFGLFDYADAPLDPAIFRLVGNLAAAAISPPPADVEDICSEVIGGG